MTLWWIGNILYLFVVIPALVAILLTVLKPARHIETYAIDINDHVAAFAPHLQSLQELQKTRQLVKQVDSDLQRYIRALDALP